MINICSSIHAQLKRNVGDRPYLARLVEEGSLCGTISEAGLWLHCLVGWKVIAHLETKLRCFWLLNQLGFHSREDVYGLISALEKESDHVSERERLGVQIPQNFIGEWEFDKAALIDHAKSKKDFHIRSNSKTFVGAAGTFKVALVLSNKGAAGLRLMWVVALGTEFDGFNSGDTHFNLEVSGAASFGCQVTMPEIASWPQPDPEELLWAEASCGTQADHFALDSSFGKHVLSGLPLLCCIRIAFSISKECCAVRPLLWIQQNSRDLLIESMFAS